MDTRAICFSALTAISETVKSFGIASLGINQEDFSKTTSNAVWMSGDRPVVDRTIQQLAYGSMDAQGIPRFDLCAEYLAAIIALFIAPCNQFAACSHQAGVMMSVDLAVQSEGTQRFDASRLYALVLCASAEAEDFKVLFNKAVANKIEHAVSPTQSEDD